MARRKKGIPSGLRSHRGSFLRSFFSDAMDTAQEAVDEFLERDFERPLAQSPETKTAPRDAEGHQASARDSEVMRQIDSLAHTIAALTAVVERVKKDQEAEWRTLQQDREGKIS
jgi:hypothetical protein